MTTMKKSKSKLEKFLIDTMYENTLFSDLTLIFIHPSFPFSMRFNVHKSIVSQSPYLCKLLEKMDHISQDSEDGKKPVTTLTIDLAQALTHCGFVLAPFQHIVRRKWQKTTNADYPHIDRQKKETMNPLLASHIRFVLKWLYSFNKQALLDTMQDADTLRILTVAVLFDVHDLTQACINRYTSEQLSLDSIMRDLDTICQLPRGHDSYLQLRDAALLLLFRFGPENASQLAMLPVDYMADILSADLLFVDDEFERYCLLRAVLMAFMQSVGKISWTEKGPVDQDAKRLSGFIRPLSNNKSLYSSLTAETVRSRKRKRIPSEDLEDPASLLQIQPRLNRLSFTALVPFEKLMADASSGGVIDKATVLSYLLRTTVNYSNMTFEQLTSVRQDGIVDEGIVFRALWQREALERVLFPLTFHYQTQEQRRIENNNTSVLKTVQENPEVNDSDMVEERNAALDEYFDVDHSDAQEKRRRLLLGTPRFRFRSSVYITAPSEENGWDCEEKIVTTNTVVQENEMNVFDDSDGSIWSSSDDEGITAQAAIDELGIGGHPSELAGSKKKTKKQIRQKTKTITCTTSYKMYKKIFYSEAQTFLGISYRLQIEAQVLPRHRLFVKDDVEERDTEEEFYIDNDPNENVMVCRFELQRDLKQIPDLPIKKEKDASANKKNGVMSVNTSVQKPTLDVREKTKIHYWIYCLNRHEGILENDRIDPEDRALVAVTEQCEREDGEPGEMGPGYVGQVLLGNDTEKGVTIDTTVALEIFGFHKV